MLHSDELLLKRFLQGTEEYAEAAFSELIERHNPLVRRVCLDVLDDPDQVQDATQAVFLVLARKARSIRKPASLGPWLHGVALRVARRIQRENARRRSAERKRAEILQGSQTTTARDEPMDHADLHEEISRLPEKYRRPIILCYMQGQTQTQAAETLGWPLGTVQIRLHRGRERLRSRLMQRDADRHELTRSALLTSLVVPPVAPEQGWSETTAHAAVRFAAGRGTSGLLTPAVARLAESTLTSMIFTPLKVFTLVTITAFLGVATVCWKGLATDHPRSSPSTTGPEAVRSQPRRAVQALRTTVAANEQDKKSTVRDTAKTPSQPGQLALPPKMPEANSHPTVPRSSLGLHQSLAMLTGPLEKTARSGRELFERVWGPNDPRSHGGDGLGPVFNAQSCVACHSLGGPGAQGGIDRNIEIASVTGNANQGMGFSYGFSMDFGTGRFEYKIGGGYPDGSAPGVSPETLRAMAAIHPGFREMQSVLLHRYGVDPAYNVWRQGLLGEHGFVRVQVTERNPPPLFGAGLIDAIPDAAIEAAARRKFSGQPAVKGRVSRLKDGRIGRFGWKAQTATLEEFVLSAAAGEIGLEVPSRHRAPDPRLPGLGSSGLDMDQADCDTLVHYVRSLPAPTALKSADPALLSQFKSGEEVFRSIGCASCHLSKLGDVNGIYSDLLLHDMGPRLADADAYTVFVNDRAKDNPDPARRCAEGPGRPGWQFSHDVAARVAHASALGPSPFRPLPS